MQAYPGSFGKASASKFLNLLFFQITKMDLHIDTKKDKEYVDHAIIFMSKHVLKESSQTLQRFGLIRIQVMKMVQN